MSQKYSPIVFLILFLSISFLLLANRDDNQVKSVHDSVNLKNTLDLPASYNTLFAGSGVCLTCHDAMVDSQNNDIGIVGWWRSTMMANASKDPFWRAKVSFEVLKNPDLQEEIESTCTRCHAPIGKFDAQHNGQTHYSIAELYADPLANDGVSCTVCHQISPESLGNYSGEIEFGTNHIIWGPYSNIFANPMINNTGYTPTYGSHIKDSELCASCHSLLTPTVDLNGQLTGTLFVEQALYQEWKNSESYENGVSCQDCHLPEINESIVISSMPTWLTGQTPFGLHELVGANVFMLNLLKNNIEALGLNASAQDFDATIARTLTKLQEASIHLDVNIESRNADSLFVNVRIENLAGHKIPGGYPSRQVFVQLTALDENNQEIFVSGQMDENFNLIHEDETFEPHHAVISSEDQVQIYQLVMGDVENNVTTTLLHADHAIKDNRLPPRGFSTDHPSYDTIRIVGLAASDPLFNPNNQGGDLIQYHIPIQGYSGEIKIEAKVFYQTINNKWLSEMFTYSSDEINTFKNMYEASDLTPVLMSSKEALSLAIYTENINESSLFYPNPTHGEINLPMNHQWEEITIYNSQGKIIEVLKLKDSITNRIKLPKTNGIYFVQLRNKLETSIIYKVLKI